MNPLNVVGLLGMAWAGPFVLLFALSLFNSRFQLRWAHVLHFFPGVAGVIFAIMGQWIVYRIFTLHLFVYLVLCTVWLFNHRVELASDDDAWRWIKYVVMSVFVLCITFALQLTFYQPLVYRLIVISATGTFYGLSWWAIGHARLFSPVRKQKAVVELYRDVGRRIQRMFDDDRVYVDPTMNVTKLSQLLKVPPYVVSRTVNGSFNKTFSELLTGYRLRHAEELLISVGDKYTVEGIAFESGFNTTTSFYSAFRKQHDMTPAQFRASMTRTKTLKHE
jgi:AraC-like DNA-binding protein